MLTPQQSDIQSVEQEVNPPRQGSDLDYFFGKYKRQLKIQQEQGQRNIKTLKQPLKDSLTVEQSHDQKQPEKDLLVKREQDLSTRGLLKMEGEEYKYKVRQRGIKKITEIDLNDPEEVQGYLKKCCRDYHKSLMDEARQNLKLQQDQTRLKKEERIISIDSNLSYFPLESEYSKLKEFQSIRELKDKLKQHEQEILKQINDDQIKSVFCGSLSQKLKKGQSGKSFHTFVCTISGCNAIIKCSLDLDRNIYDIYLLRNRHNHTITGHIFELTREKKSEVVILDEDLHEMFGFNKGVRSQTRNLRYVSPLQRKKIEYQKKRQRIIKRRRLEESRKKQMVNQDNQEQDTENDGWLDTKSKAVDHSKKYFIFNNKKVQDIEFKNLPQQLSNKGYIVDTPYQETNIPQLVFISKKQLLELTPHPTTLRICHRQSMIKLDKRRGIANTIWSVFIITALNQNLKPLVLAIGILSKPLAQELPKILAILLKYFPNLKFLLSEYEPNMLTAFQKGQIAQSFQLLLDHSDVLKLLKKHCQEEQHIKALKEMMNPVNYYKRQSFEKYLRNRNENKLLERFQQFKKYTLISQSGLFQFQGTDVDLTPEKELFLKIKQRVRSGLGRYSLKLHLHNIFDWIHSHNKSSQIIPESILQIQKFHHDYYLKSVRTSVAPSILNQFYLNYGQSINLESSLNEHGQIQFQRGKVYVRQLICSCGYTRIIGIPCKHLISVLKEKTLPYLASFDKRWIVRQDSLLDELKEQRYRSRDEPRKKQKRAKNNLKQLIERVPNQGQQQQDMQHQQKGSKKSKFA